MQNAITNHEFADRLTAMQMRLYRYILTLLPLPDQANDVFQETNLALWRESSKFAEGTNFEAWACRVAYFQVLTHRRKAHRKPMLFGDDFLKDLAGPEHASADLDNIDEKLVFLRECIKRLTPDEQKLVRKRYGMEFSLKAIAMEIGQSPNWVGVVLFRIRQDLLKCVQNKMNDQHDGE